MITAAKTNKNPKVANFNFINVSGHGMTDANQDPNLVVLSGIPDDNDANSLDYKYINFGDFKRKMA